MILLQKQCLTYKRGFYVLTFCLPVVMVFCIQYLISWVQFFTLMGVLSPCSVVLLLIEGKAPQWICTLPHIGYVNKIYFHFLLTGTIFLEYWKRTNATLAYEWDVNDFETNEPDRPQFYGLKFKQDPVTMEKNWFYPFKRQLMKYFCSCTTLFFMVRK